MPATPDSPARYLAWLYTPPPQKSLLRALFGIEREVAESLHPGLDHHVAHTRLQWWREECERTAGGRAVHPLTREALEAFAPGVGASDRQALRGASQLAGLTGFVDTAVWDLARATFVSRRELTAYCERWASAMIEPVAAHAGSAHSASNWRRLGAALRELELLTDLAREARSGRLRLPLDEVAGAGSDPASLARPPWPEPVADLLRGRIAALERETASGLRSVGADEQAASRGLIVWIAVVSKAAERMVRALPQLRRPGRLDSIADPWFAWRAARSAAAGRFRAGGDLENPR